jgi:hypothetical protein
MNRRLFDSARILFALAVSLSICDESHATEVEGHGPSTMSLLFSIGKIEGNDSLDGADSYTDAVFEYRRLRRVLGLPYSDRLHARFEYAELPSGFLTEPGERTIRGGVRSDVGLDRMRWTSFGDGVSYAISSRILDWLDAGYLHWQGDYLWFDDSVPTIAEPEVQGPFIRLRATHEWRANLHTTGLVYLAQDVGASFMGSRSIRHFEVRTVFNNLAASVADLNGDSFFALAVSLRMLK